MSPRCRCEQAIKLPAW